MKKIFWLVLTVVLLFTCTSCSFLRLGGEVSVPEGTGESLWTPTVLEMEEILAMENDHEFVQQIWYRVGEKCGYGEDLSVLSSSERIFFVTLLLEAEVNNGGFSQYFFNSSGDYANEVAAAYEEIGAVKTAEICRKACSLFGEEVPRDWELRQTLLMLHDEYEPVLNECDSAFYAYEEDLASLTRDYVLNHLEDFS